MADAKPILLMAEDDAGLAPLLKELFGRQYDVRLFDSGEAALDELRTIGRPVVMLTDNGLAGKMTGFNLIEQARKLYPDMPAVMISGYVTDPQQQVLQGLGVQLLGKPCRLPEIDSALAAAQRKLDGGRTPIGHAVRPSQNDGKGHSR